MKWERPVSVLSADGLVDIGSPGVGHLVMTVKPCRIQRSEVTDSKRRLEDILGRPVNSFAHSCKEPPGCG